MPVVSHQNLPKAPLISENLLENDTSFDNIIGSGSFGSCTKMMFKDMYTVCVKKMSTDISWSAVKSEAAILSNLNTGNVTPHCFGICLPLHAIVMSFINIDDRPMSLYQALIHEPEGTSIVLNSHLCAHILVDVCKGLEFIHSKGFLHNDIKLVNIALGRSRKHELKAWIIDFGKARPIHLGKTYSLSEAEQDRFKVEHTHIAPDLRDGLVLQSTATDVYSFGKILKRCNLTVIQSTKLPEIIRKVLSYHSKDRPCLQSILSVLTQNIENDG